MSANLPPDATASGGLSAWVERFDAAPLPVLAETAAMFERLRAIEERVDAHGIADELGSDPLFVTRVLAQVSAMRRRRGFDADGGPETLTEALVLWGIGPLFGTWAEPLPVVAGAPEAQAGFERVLRRCHRAARFSLAFANQRGDHDAAVLHEAALLHDLAELLLWLHAPQQAVEIARRQAADPTLRSDTVQAELLGTTLGAIQHALMQRWGLPPLVVHLADDAVAQGPNALAQRNVALAVRLARHSAQGWDNAALPDDYRDIAELLHIGTPQAETLVKDVDGDA
jgi:HD-like signal output (HDOD) protein